ncbi:MAG: hypothetical protein WKF57_13165 [Nakamurella sp.]
MKLCHTLTALVAGAAFALTACGNDSTPAAGVPAAGVPAAAGASSVAAGSATTEAPDSEPAGSDTTGSDTTGSDTTSSDTTDAPDTDSGDAPQAGPGGACAGLITLTNDFTEKILTKATSGGVTQADVDAVFSDQALASIPEDLKADVEKLKELSQQLVGKSAADSVSALQEISTVYQGLATKVTGGSCS